MATTSGEQARPKIISENGLEVFKFDQQISFDKFSARNYDVDTDNFVPPRKCGPKYFIRFKPRTNWSGLSHGEYYEKHTYSRNIDFDYICLQLHLESSTKKNTIIEGTTYVLGRDGTKRISAGFSAYHCQGYFKPAIFCKKRTEVVGVTNELLSDDKLTFYCEFTFTVETSVARTTLDSDQLVERFDELGRINEDFGRLLIDGKLTDLQIVVGGKEFRAHKCILAARSPVFSAMFQHDTKEKQDNRVEITDVDSDVFREVLRYIYTGKIGSLDKFGAELLVVADKYQLDSLKVLCEDTLCDQLSSKTVAELIVLADQHNAQKLKQCALEYFRKNTQESIESLFETNKSEALIKAFRDLTLGHDKQDGSSNKG